VTAGSQRISALRAGRPSRPGAEENRIMTYDVQGFPPTIISVNECDPLRDEGINFYRLLLRAGVPARCRQVMGTMHGTETFTIACPEISRDTARDLAAFCKSG
jgi:acetyl esterase/lipase